MRFLTTPDTFLAILIVVMSIALSIAGMSVVRRRVSLKTLNENHEAAGYVFALVSGVYGVLLAFIVVVAWQQYTDAEASAQHEALRISNLLRDSRVFDAETQALLRGRLIEYAKAVVEDEWEIMPSGQPSHVANGAYERLWDAYYNFHPQTEHEKIFYQESIHRMNEISSTRRARLISSRSGLPRTLWVLLIGGGIVVIAFTYLFGTKSAITQTLTVGALAGLIGFLLFLILALDFPFSGNLGIEPDALRGVIQNWETGPVR